MIAARAPFISGVASIVASSPSKKAVSPPPGWAGPLIMTPPMSMPRRGSRMQCSVLMRLVCRLGSRTGSTVSPLVYSILIWLAETYLNPYKVGSTSPWFESVDSGHG